MTRLRPVRRAARRPAAPREPRAADRERRHGLAVEPLSLAGFLYQDPYYTACTAAATMMMLNFIDLNDSGGDGFRWTTYRTKNSSDRSRTSAT